MDFLEEAFNVTITELMVKNFEKFTGDINPLHTSLQFANSRGFTKKIVYGMLTASFYSTLIGFICQEKIVYYMKFQSFSINQYMLEIL